MQAYFKCVKAKDHTIKSERKEKRFMSIAAKYFVDKLSKVIKPRA